MKHVLAGLVIGLIGFAGYALTAVLDGERLRRGKGRMHAAAAWVYGFLVATVAYEVARLIL